MHPSELSIRFLASELGLSSTQLVRTAKAVPNSYKSSRLTYDPKKRKYRRITPPRHRTKKFLERVHKILQHHIRWQRCVHNGPRRRSCKTAVRGHLGKNHWVIRDIHQCYPSVSADKLLRRLMESGIPQGTARLFGMISIRQGEMPQGSPLSSTMLNLYLWTTDQILTEEASKSGGRYERYADDAVISTNLKDSVPVLEDLIDNSFGKAELPLSPTKSRTIGNRQDVVILGLKVNNPRGVACPKKVAKEALLEAKSYERGCAVVSPDSLVPLARKRARLVGLLHHFRQMDFSPARHFWRVVRRADAKVLRRLHAVGLTPKRGKWWLHAPKKGRQGTMDCACVRLAAQWRKRTTVA